jgi:Spy/CpxP family protein refolding chaperone
MKGADKPMENHTRSKWVLRAVILGVFVLGFVAGAFALNLYRNWARRGPARGGDRFEQLSTRLQLKDDQKPKVKQIFDDSREQLRTLRKESEPRVNDIRQQTDTRLKEVLTTEQWQRFEQMRNEMRSRRAGRDDRGMP